MEPNYNKVKFFVICNDEKYLNQTIEWYNSTYKTDFIIVKIIQDEVNFAELEVSKYELSDLFTLGYLWC